MKVKAEEFIKKYRIKRLDCHVLKMLLGKMGYETAEFDGAGSTCNDCEMPEGYPKGIKCFTHMPYKTVYLHSELTDDEKVIVLAHECAHIFLKHEVEFTFDAGVKNEYEANEFVHYLFIKLKRKRIVKSVAVALGALAVLSAVIVTLSFTLSAKDDRNELQFGEYYITKTGYKYHSPGCPRLSGKSGVELITKEQFESGMYEPCGSCKPLK